MRTGNFASQALRRPTTSSLRWRPRLSIPPGNGPTAGQNLKVSEGENVENVDIELYRGGVITGRVTDSQKQPLVGKYEFCSEGSTRTVGLFIISPIAPVSRCI